MESASSMNTVNTHLNRKTTVPKKRVEIVSKQLGTLRCMYFQYSSSSFVYSSVSNLLIFSSHSLWPQINVRDFSSSYKQFTSYNILIYLHVPTILTLKDQCKMNDNSIAAAYILSYKLSTATTEVSQFNCHYIKDDAGSRVSA